MPELDDMQNDDLMNAVFADVRQEVAGYIRPAGAAAAVATVKRRRRNRTIAGAALAVALVVGPAIGLAWAQNRPDGTPDVADPTPSVSASESAPATPSAGPSGSGSPSVIDQGIPMSQLRNSTLTLPAWPGAINDGCASGAVKFTDGKNDKSVLLTLAGDPVYVDVDADGRNETVIRVDCALQGIFTQVLAFSRDADGKITTRKVVVTHVEGSDVKKVWKIEPDGTTAVRVDVGDVSPCCGLPADLPQHQWRVYGWDGQKFRQTGGQTKFPVNPKTTDLATSVQPLTMTADGAAWKGTLQVTVRNVGPNTANRVDVNVQFPIEVTVAGADAGRCEPKARSEYFTCRFDKLAAGDQRVVRLDVTANSDPRGLAVSVASANGGTNDEGYPDIKQDNNVVEVIAR